MPQPILTVADYQEIRDAIEPGLSSFVLPDNVVGREVYEGRAELDILAVIPDAYTRTDPTEVARLRLAAILLTAAYIRQSWQPLRRETVGPYSYDRQRQDPNLMAESLLARAYAQLYLLADLRPKAMDLALGDRGNLRVTVQPTSSNTLLGWPD